MLRRRASRARYEIHLQDQREGIGAEQHGARCHSGDDDRRWTDAEKFGDLYRVDGRRSRYRAVAVPGAYSIAGAGWVFTNRRAILIRRLRFFEGTLSTRRASEPALKWPGCKVPEKCFVMFRSRSGFDAPQLTNEGNRGTCCAILVRGSQPRPLAPRRVRVERWQSITQGGEGVSEISNVRRPPHENALVVASYLNRFVNTGRG